MADCCAFVLMVPKETLLETSETRKVLFSSCITSTAFSDSDLIGNSDEEKKSASSNDDDSSLLFDPTEQRSLSRDLLVTQESVQFMNN